MINKGLSYDAAKKQMYEDYLEEFTEEQKAIIIRVVKDRLSSRIDKTSIKENLTMQSLKKMMEVELYSGYTSLDPEIQFVNIYPDYLQIKGLGKKQKITWGNVLNILKRWLSENYDHDEKYIVDVADKMMNRLQTKVDITTQQIKINYFGKDDLNRILDLLQMIEE